MTSPRADSAEDPVTRSSPVVGRFPPHDRFDPSAALLPVLDAIHDVRMPVTGGSVVGRVLVPRMPANGVIVFYPGGGWVTRGVDHTQPYASALAERTGCVVVVVDYRLAPMYPFPTAVGDAESALRWVRSRIESLAGRRAPLILAGEGVGANLAAVVAIRARNADGPPIAIQVLLGPVTDCDFDTASYGEPDNQGVLGRDAMIGLWDQYVPDAAARLDPAVSPLRMRYLAGLPPAVVVTGERDVLRAEGEFYATRLLKAGVPVRHRRFAEQGPGFVLPVGLDPAADDALTFVSGAVMDALAAPVGPEWSSTTIPPVPPVTDPVPPTSVPPARPGEFDVVVIGAGVAGLYAIHKLRGLGFAVHGVERGSGVGGTWYWNRYPGARCDSEVMQYSFSFLPALEQEWPLAERFPSQPLILGYLQTVAKRLDLEREFSFDTTVRSLEFDDAAERWTIQTSAGELRARFVVTAVGCLSAANRPDLPGLDDFRGQVLHTGDWPREGVTLAGRRVGIVGTGSTGIQLIPIVAREAEHLTVFQRTAQFTVPANNYALAAPFVDLWKANYPEWRRRTRHSVGGAPFPRSHLAAFDVPADQRRRMYEEGWRLGGSEFVGGTFNDLLIDDDANATAADFIRAKIGEIVQDPRVAEMLTPHGFPFATKRPPMDTDYYATYNRPNVELVDLRRTPIAGMTATGLRTEGREHPLDMLVFATGFDAVTGPLLGLDIHGLGGRRLADQWVEGPQTYLGLAIPGFPNLFTVTGPQSPSVLVNVPTAIEQHVDWIADCLVWLRERGATRIEAERDAAEEWSEHVREVANRTLFPKADSWYTGANIAGKARGFLLYTGGLLDYSARCDAVAEAGYVGFVARSTVGSVHRAVRP